jgi:predicted amidophosphoribosyltransferase
MPFSDRCSNQGFDDRWTCPGCYSDLEGAVRGEMTCPHCEARLDLSVDYEPVSVARLIAGGEDD